MNFIDMYNVNAICTAKIDKAMLPSPISSLEDISYETAVQY